MAELSRRTHIGESTLCAWKRKLGTNPAWRPSRRAYALPRRIFTDEQEDRLVDRIVTDYLSKGLFYCDEDFKLDARRFYDEICAELEEKAAFNPEDAARLHRMPDFKVSGPFIRDFRSRHGMALRRPSLRRRRRVTEEEMTEFVHRVEDVMGRIPPERIVNLDETNWRSVSPGFLTWGHRGAESVPCTIEKNEKEGITVIAAVDAAGNKLPLTIIGKWKTPRCLAAMDLPTNVWTSVSTTGCTNSEVMCTYLALLRMRAYPDGRLVVMLDTYSAHRAQVVREAAERHGIELLFIPPGCTDRLQPLDRKIFGVLKGYARQLWRQQYHALHGGKTTRARMASNLIEAWNRITPDVIESAWAIYQGNWGAEISDDSEADLLDSDYHPEVTNRDLQDLA
jgi:hypothetical protein